jgi:hypothetical protein
MEQSPRRGEKSGKTRCLSTCTAENNPILKLGQMVETYQKCEN